MLNKCLQANRLHGLYAEYNFIYLKLIKMKKFKLSKNDSQSLENSSALISNNVLKNAVVDITRTDLSDLSGGWSRLAFGRVDPGWGKAIPAQQ